MASDNHILQLSDDALREIASSLRSGRMKFTPTSADLAHVIGSPRSEAVAEALIGWQAKGFNNDQLAFMLDLVVRCHQQRARVEDQVDLVVTGPETLGVVVRETAAVVHEIFSHAEHSVTVVGYAVHQGQRVFKALAERMVLLPSLRVRMLLDVQRTSDDATPEQTLERFVQRFRNKEWPIGYPLPKVFYYPPSLREGHDRSSLHAKCVIIDSRIAFVSSANFTEAAHERNIEAGVLIRSPAISGYLQGHFDGLLNDGVLLPIL